MTLATFDSEQILNRTRRKGFVYMWQLPIKKKAHRPGERCVAVALAPVNVGGVYMKNRYEYSKNLPFKEASGQWRGQTGRFSQESWEGLE